MKTTVKLLLAVTMAAFCCSIGKADNIIYSNNFSLGTGVNISNTPPTVANSFAGGTNTAVWQDTDGTFNTHGPLLDTGIDNCAQIDYWALPFTPQSNFIYLLTVNVTFTNNPGIAPEFGFSTNLFTNNFSGDARFNGNSNGYDWMAPTESTGNIQYFAGPKTTTTIANINNIFPGNTPSTNTFQILLNTKSNLWSAVGYVNGVQAGSVFNYSASIPNPTNILSVGISLNGTASLPTAIQYNTFSLSTTLQPFITAQPVATKTVGGGSAYSNSVTLMYDSNGGPLVYQWYANNQPLTNGVSNVSGANTNTLVINPIGTVNQFTNYYLVVSNIYGSATSSLASITVLTNISIIKPSPATNAITLLAGSSGAVGSSPDFTITALGAPPITYEWLTNGVVVPKATNNSLAFTNIQGSGPATILCIVSNSFGPTNALWNATYLPAPTAAYPLLVLGAQPFDFWRLNEADDGHNDGNGGAVAYDNGSGNNGVYTNVTLGQDGYNTLETPETSMYVTAGFPQQPSCMSRVVGGDLAAIFPSGSNATFTVEAWANCITANGASGGAPVVAQGTNGGSSFFLGVDTNSVTKHYQFYVRNAAGTMFSADNTTGIEADDGNWHYIVGVCDEVHSNVTLYIDGVLAATTAITPATGLFESGFPVAIGAGIRVGASDYNIPFTGNIDDVAIYTHALTYAQVINHFSAVNNNKVALTFQAPLVPANIVYLANRTLTIPAIIDGSGPISYTWTDVTSGATLASGSTTNSGTLDATLTIPNAPASMSGDQLQLVANNSANSLNATVNLLVQPAPVALDYSDSILYTNAFNGGTYNLVGLPPSEVNLLVGGTNTLWIDGKVTNNGVMQANGIPTSNLQDSWVLPFTPEPGYIYTLTATVAFTANPGNWVALGFFQNLTNAADARINGGLNGYDWLLVQFSGNVQSFAGPSGTGPISNAVIATVGVATHTIKIVLDTTTNSANWMGYSFVDGHPSGTNKYTTKPTVIGGVGIAQNGPTVPTAIQWSSFALTQVAPGGVAPYLLSPLPPTNNIVLSNAMVAINATAYGSTPLGYYWTNNSTVVASGTTSTPPLSANLSVASSSLSAGQLKLVVTNAYGTNITTITLVSPVNTNAGPIQYAVTNNQLNLSWPTNLGWTLQAQTNSIGAGISTNSANWFNVANSTTTNQVTVPISTTNGSVFYRLILP